MKSFTIIAIAVMSAIGCSTQPAVDDDALPPEIAKAMEQIAHQQSRGLKGATVIVHRAYEYHGHTWIEPLETAKLIAVDVEFRRYNSGFDLDDVDIIDGESGENYGSNPDIVKLLEDGNLAIRPNDESEPDQRRLLRRLLIYPFPKNSTKLKLSYWGDELTPNPIPIAGDGPSLLKPMQQESRVPKDQ